MTTTTSNPPPSAPASTPPPAALPVVREKVRDMLLGSEAFRSLPVDQQQQIAHDTVDVMHYLSNPEGIADEKLRAASAALSLATTQVGRDPTQFRAQGVREGAAATKLYLDAVNFPAFVGGLITNVFHAIVTSSIEQMEAYGKLVADVAKTLNQFRDDNVTQNQGRDHLVDQYPDIFEISVDTGDDGGQQPRVRMKDGVDQDAAVGRLKDMPTEGGPVDSLDDDTVENKLVPAARTQLATSRQQLLATMVLMGINRIVVTDGKIQAKVLFDFKAQDRFTNKTSATQFDYAKDQYGNTQYATSSEGTYGSGTGSDQSGGGDSGSAGTDAGNWTKGTYKNTAQPVISLASASQSTTQADLTTKAQLSGLVDINFKSDYLPLEKMADSFQIANIQSAARPGQAKAAGAGGAAPASGATAPASGGTSAASPAPATTAPAAAPATPAR